MFRKKCFIKLQHQTFIKKEKRNCSKAKIENLSISLIKGTYKKFTKDIAFNAKVMKTFHLKSGITIGFPLPLLLFNINI